MLIEIELKKLKPLEKNPRKITKENLDKLCKSITEDPGFLLERPCLVNEVDGVYTVYAGNQRLAAAKKLGMTTIPCYVRQNLDDEIMRKRIIKDNKTYGEFDFDVLASEWDHDILKDCGFEDKDFPTIEEIEPKEKTDTEPEALKDKAITQLGDLYELGNHRIICGDSTDPDTVTKVLNGAEPILMVTDPPYGVEYDPSWKKISDGIKGRKIKSFGKVQNDHISDWGLAYSLFPGSVAYVWFSSLNLPDVAKNLKDCKFDLKYLIIWVKQIGFNRGDYHWYHESCWYAVRHGHKHNWHGSRKERTVWEIQSRAALGDTTKNEEASGHSTQKPLECMARPIRNNSAVGEGVYDPFLGSGTTLIAAENLQRICYGIEINPAYVDMAVKRWMKHTGKSVKRNGIEIKKWEE